MITIIVFIIIILIARYIPGIKCVTYCKYRQYKYHKAIKTLKQIGTKNAKSYFGIDVLDIKTNISFIHLTKKQLIVLYKDSEPYGCSALKKNEWQEKVREKLKNAIVERELLED